MRPSSRLPLTSALKADVAVPLIIVEVAVKIVSWTPDLGPLAKV